MKYIDAHCHLLGPSAIADARAAGCAGMIINATQMDQWGRIAEMTGRGDGVHGAIGIHPWYVDDAPDNWAGVMREMLGVWPELMIGETGLDAVRGDMTRQVNVFKEHMNIAHEFDRVVHVHCVRAWGVMLDILRGAPRVRAIVFHAYSGAPELIPELTKYNGYFSFGGAILNARHMRATMSVARAPRERILVESDAPDSSVSPSDMAEILGAVHSIAGVNSDTIYENTVGVIK